MNKKEGKEMNFFEELDYEYNRAKKFMNKVKPHHYIMGFVMMFALIGFISYFGATLVSMFLVVPFAFGAVVDGDKIKEKWNSASKTQKGMAIGGLSILAPFILIGALWLVIFGLLYSPMLVIFAPLLLLGGHLFYRKKNVEEIGWFGKVMKGNIYGLVVIVLAVVVLGYCVYNYTSADDQDGLSASEFLLNNASDEFVDTISGNIKTGDIEVRTTIPSKGIVDGSGANITITPSEDDPTIQYANVYLYPFEKTDEGGWKTDWTCRFHWSSWETTANGTTLLEDLPIANYTILITRSGYEDTLYNVYYNEMSENKICFANVSMLPICWNIEFTLKLEEKNFPHFSYDFPQGYGSYPEWNKFINWDTKEENLTDDDDKAIGFPTYWSYGVGMGTSTLPLFDYSNETGTIEYSNNSANLFTIDGDELVFKTNNPYWEYLNRTIDLRNLTTIDLKISGDERIKRASDIEEKYFWFSPLARGEGGFSFINTPQTYIMVVSFTPLAESTNMVVSNLIGFDQSISLNSAFSGNKDDDNVLGVFDDIGSRSKGFVKQITKSIVGEKWDAGTIIDTDGDGVIDKFDAYPKDASEFADTDNDGIGDNADSDADGDGFTDENEIRLGSDPFNSESTPLENYLGSDNLPLRPENNEAMLTSKRVQDFAYTLAYIRIVPRIITDARYLNSDCYIYNYQGQIKQENVVNYGNLNANSLEIMEISNESGNFYNPTGRVGQGYYQETFSYSYMKEDRQTISSHTLGIQFHIQFYFKPIDYIGTTDIGTSTDIEPEYEYKYINIGYATPIMKMTNPYQAYVVLEDEAGD